MPLFRRKTPTLDERLTEMFKNPPMLETERMYLTKIIPAYAEDVFEYSKDPDVTRYLTWSPHVSIKETERYIKLLGRKYESGAFRDFGLVLKENGRMIGTCGYTSADNEDMCVELGYVLARDMWGKGLATEAARCLASYAVENFGVKKLMAKLIDGNTASMNVMKKLGMRLEGTYYNSMFIKGEYKTIHVFEADREHFLASLPKEK